MHKQWLSIYVMKSWWMVFFSGIPASLMSRFIQFKNKHISQPNIFLPKGSTSRLIKHYYPLLEILLTDEWFLSGVI